jgi:hypothetical protein
VAKSSDADRSGNTDQRRRRFGIRRSESIEGGNPSISKQGPAELQAKPDLFVSIATNAAQAPALTGCKQVGNVI